jgi:carbonic anhydrase
MNKALYRLMSGFRKFREKYYILEESEKSVYQRLSTDGQTPKTLLIGCSDSRVDPAILTSASPGELFVIRNVANLVPPYEASASGYRGTSSALEFAVKGLKVENIVVLGHRQCGGVRALMTGSADSSTDFIGPWMSIANEAKERVLREHSDKDPDIQWKLAEMEVLKVSLKNLKTFPFVQEAVESRQLNLVAVYFDLEQGQLWELDPVMDSFQLLII